MNSSRDRNCKNKYTEKKLLVRLVNKLYSRYCTKYTEKIHLF